VTRVPTEQRLIFGALFFVFIETRSDLNDTIWVSACEFGEKTRASPRVADRPTQLSGAANSGANAAE